MSRRQEKKQKTDGWVLRFRAWAKDNRVYLLSFCIPLLFWLAIAVLMKYAPFGDNSLLYNDATHQYYPFMGQYRERLLEHESLFYSNSGGLGFNFLSLWTYYLSSPLNLLVVLFPAAELDSAMNLLIILKASLGGFGFAYFLGSRGKKQDLTILSFAAGYSLSSFMMGYSFNIMWLDSVALFPIVLAGLEKLLKEGKCRLYVLSLALSLWCSFYISFMICIFLVLWFCIRKFHGVWDLLKKGFLFAGSSFLAAGMACVVLLPAYIGISQTQLGEKLPQPEWFGSFWDILAGKEGGIFLFSDPISVLNDLPQSANLYCGIFVLGLCVLYFFIDTISIEQKIKAVFLVLLLVVSMNSNVLNFVWHGFHAQVGIPNRFVFLLLFLCLLLAYEGFSHVQECKVWQVLLSHGVTLAGIGCLVFFKGAHLTVWSITGTILAVILYGGLLLALLKKPDRRKMLAQVFCVIACMEILANGAAGSKYQHGVSIGNFYRSPGDVQEAGRQIEYSGYRAELSNPGLVNEGMAYNLHGTGMFSSMVNSQLAGVLNSIGFSGAVNKFSNGGSTPVINTLFGIKHMLRIGSDANRMDYRYQEKNTVGDVTVYENSQVLPLAFLGKSDALDWSSLDSDYFQNQNELLRLLTGSESEVFTKQPYELVEANDITPEHLDGDQQYAYLEAKGQRSDHLVFEADIEEDEDLYFCIRARYADKVEVHVNDKMIAKKSLTGAYYHIGNVKKGDRVKVKVGITGDSPTFGRVSLAMYAYHQEEMDKAYQMLSKSQFHMEETQEGIVRGQVLVEGEDMVLYTTVPYEKGWELMVDQKPVKLQTMMDVLIAIPLEKGEHRIELRFTPPGFAAGAMVSFASILLFLCGIFIQEKRKRTRLNSQTLIANQKEIPKEEKADAQTRKKDGTMEKLDTDPDRNLPAGYGDQPDHHTL